MNETQQMAERPTGDAINGVRGRTILPQGKWFKPFFWVIMVFSSFTYGFYLLILLSIDGGFKLLKWK